MTTAWDEYIFQCQREFPKLRVRDYDDSWFFRILRRLGWSMAATSWYNTVFMEKDYIGTDRGLGIMKHEMVHIRDMHKWHILFFLSYFFLPIGPSFKAFWEWRAYKIDLIEMWNEYFRFFADPEYKDYSDQIIGHYRDWIVNTFSGSSYAWMWPFRWHMRKVVDRYLQELSSTTPRNTAR